MFVPELYLETNQIYPVVEMRAEDRRGQCAAKQKPAIRHPCTYTDTVNAVQDLLH